MKYLKTFIGAVLAGMTIGIGGVAFLSVDNKIVGAFLFAVGLYIICTQGLMLFTGKVGYLVNEKPAYLLDLLIIWFGNLAGTAFTGLSVQFTRIEAIRDKARVLTAAKTGDDLPSIFILGIFCGILMFTAVDGYKKTQNPLIIFICVAAFIICGFEHCIANMFYFFVATDISGNALLCILAATAGNTLGGILIPLAGRLSAK